MYLYINKVDITKKVLINFELYKLNEKFEVIETFHYEENINFILNCFTKDQDLNLLGLDKLKHLINSKHQNKKINLSDIKYIYYEDYDILDLILNKLDQNIKKFDLIDLKTMHHLMVINGFILKHEKPEWLQLIKAFNYKF